MKKIFCILTMIYGLFWLVFGLNNFLHFFSIPQPSAAGADFMQALERTGYALPLIYATQVLTGLLLLARKFVPLALLLLAPIVANIFLYDLFLNPAGLTIGVAISTLYLIVLFDQRLKFIPLLKP